MSSQLAGFAAESAVVVQPKGLYWVGLYALN